MKQNEQHSGIERIYKTELALSLTCWIFTAPFSNWTSKLFCGAAVADDVHPDEDPKQELFFRFVVNQEGFDAGFDAIGKDLCCFSLPPEMIPGDEVAEFERMTVMTGEVIHGILLSLPEFIDMPESLAYQVRDEVLAFNAQGGEGIFHGWRTAHELWKNEIYPRTTILLNNTAAIH